MSSPKIVSFFLFNPTTNAPVTGQASSMSFVTYKDEAGTNLSQPSFVEIGGGGYYFIPVFADPTHGIAYCVNTGTGANPSRISGYIRPEDYSIDLISNIDSNIQDLHDIEFGKWQVFATGSDANRLVLYKPDGSTIINKFDLKDSTGAATFTNPFARIPLGGGGGGGITLTSIAVTPNRVSVATGATQQMTAIGTYSDSSTLNITSAVAWSSNHTGIGSINSGSGGGLLTGVSDGTCTITASLSSVNGTSFATVATAGVAARSTLSQAYTLNSGVPAGTFLNPIYLPSDAGALTTISLTNQSGTTAAINGPSVSPVDVAIYASDGAGNPTGSPLYTWLGQTIPAGSPWTSPTFDARPAIGTDHQFVLAFATPAGATLLTSTGVQYGKYSFGTASVNPLPSGFVDDPNGLLGISVHFFTGKKRIVVQGDSIPQGYSADATVHRNLSGFYKIATDNDWAVDLNGIPGLTLDQANDVSNTELWGGQLLTGAIGLSELSINSLPSLASVADYKSKVQIRTTAMKNAGAAKVVWTTLTASAAYPSYDTLRLAINADLRANYLTYGIDALYDMAADLDNTGTTPQTMQTAYACADGTHPNEAGHAVIAAGLYAVIAPL